MPETRPRQKGRLLVEYEADVSACGGCASLATCCASQRQTSSATHSCAGIHDDFTHGWAKWCIQVHVSFV
jgi:hypothetical protein